MTDDINQPNAENTKKNNNTLALLGSIFFIVITIVGLYVYIQYRDDYPSTDDAYVQAHVVNVAPQVSGPVITINVHNNQAVKKNDVLFTIDDRPFQARLSKAQAHLKMANQTVAASADAIKEGASEVTRMKANLDVTRKHAQRILQLVKKEQASIAAGDNARGELASAEAAYHAAKNKLAKIKANLGELSKENAQIRNALADLNNAQLDVDYTQVKAPEDGIITNFNLRPGTMVNAGIPLFQLIESRQWWVDANYKETQLKQIRPGQPATIILDMYPHHTFQGIVDSVSGGSGAAFSLLPAENASGNWVKVVQRFTVKVLFKQLNPQFPLRVGASSTVTIDTTNHNAAKKDKIAHSHTTETVASPTKS